jgi:hypothetical protein
MRVRRGKNIRGGKMGVIVLVSCEEGYYIYGSEGFIWFWIY